MFITNGSNWKIQFSLASLLNVLIILGGFLVAYFTTINEVKQDIAINKEGIASIQKVIDKIDNRLYNLQGITIKEGKY